LSAFKTGHNWSLNMAGFYDGPFLVLPYLEIHQLNLSI
jgi:hypothetical protein